MTVPLAAQVVHDYAALARVRLDAATWAYLAQGDEPSGGGTPVGALADVRLMPRPLADVRGAHTRVTLFGQTLEHPILLAPVAYQRLFHPQGEAASAIAAAAQGGQMLISSLASQPFDAIVAAARDGDGVDPWFQLYWQGGRMRTLRLLQRALQAGCTAVVLTVDAPVKVASLQLPTGIEAVNLEAAGALPAGASQVFDGWMAQAPRWDDLEWLRQQVPVPLVIKGLLHPDDAQRAVDAGCDGVIVSNHGGRVLRGTACPLDSLRRVVQRVGERVPVIFDSGVRDGRDAFVALAYGARAVMIGRPYIWGLAANGPLGVAHVIRLMRDELEMTMALCGCASIAEIGCSSLAPQPGQPWGDMRATDSDC